MLFEMPPERNIINGILRQYYGEKVDTTLVVADIIDSLLDANYEIVYAYTRRMMFFEMLEYHTERLKDHNDSAPLYFKMDGVEESFRCFIEHSGASHFQIIGFPAKMPVKEVDPRAWVTVNL